MGLTLFGRTLTKIGVVGCGQMGPGIALFYSRTLGPRGVPVVLTDVSPDALQAGRERFQKKLRKAGESGTYRPAEIAAIEKNVSFTLDKSLLVRCDLVVEAGPEKLEAKQALFDELERLVEPHAVLASTSSHLEPEPLFAQVRRPERAIVLHHLFPADTNPIVEVVPGPRTEVTEWCLRFLEGIGKVPLRAGPRYGYAIGPVYEGLFLAAALLAESGVPPKVIEAIVCRGFDQTAGPFTMMNLTQANAQRQAGLNAFHEKIMPWFRSPASLDKKVPANEKWETIDSGDTVSYSDATFQKVMNELMGAYFGLACEVVASGTSTVEDLNLAVELGLAMKPPFTLMNELGPRRSRELVERYAAAHPGFKVPSSFGPWPIPHVLRRDTDGVAILTLRRPQRMNALNRDTFRELDAHLTAIKADARVAGVVLTGFGTRAFASGADIQMLAAARSSEEARTLSRESHAALFKIENLGKPVVCALNGLSLGGGSELAYACTARIARKGLPLLFGQPEVKLGIIPGAGGTQRLPRLIDFATAWKLLRKGGTLSGEEALRLGLIHEEVEGDLLERAVELARALKPRALPPAKVPPVLPEVDLGGLSRKVDEILRKAILEGAPLPLEKAAEVEIACFGEAFDTRDRQIGMENYLKTKLSRPAAFVHA